MSNTIFEAFAERIAMSFNDETINPNSFKSEYAEMLYELGRQQYSPVISLRILGRFKIELIHLKSYLFDEKKVVVSTYVS